MSDNGEDLTARDVIWTISVLTVCGCLGIAAIWALIEASAHLMHWQFS